MKTLSRFFWAAFFACLWFAPAPAQVPACDCATTGDSICNSQGFRITLVDFSVDQDNGISNWDYRICDETGMGTGCDAPKDLSHIDFNLPSLGTCLSPIQTMSLSQLTDFDKVTLACGVSEKDPACDIFGTSGVDYVAKCDVSGGDLDPGECVTMRLSIAGEQPTLGAGASLTVTKAGPECVFDCILGPSCEPCFQEMPDECLTRTAGFWGTHPHITTLFLPVTVCGQPLTGVEANSCQSATEAMCVAGGRESRANPPYAQLVRQLTAAKLNLAATAANGGSCAEEIDQLIQGCEMLCGANKKVISNSGCIEALAAFNESPDTFPTTPPPFDRPGPANPRECQIANGNGLLIGPSCP